MIKIKIINYLDIQFKTMIGNKGEIIVIIWKLILG